MSSFVRTLVGEGKVKLVEASDEIAESYLSKSGKSLISAKALLKLENFDDATALVYYSMYYSAIALFFKCGIKCENHTGTIILLKEIFGVDNGEILKAKKERVDKQHYVDFKATKDDVLEGIRTTERFNTAIRERIETLKGSEKNAFREKFRRTYS